MTAVLEPAMARVSGVPGYPVRAVDDAAREAGDHSDVLWFSASQQAKLTAGVAREDWLVSQLTEPFPETEQRQWVGAVLAAARACDQAALARLDPR